MKHTLIWLTIFSIAMGFLESAVVVYLREIYYPNGFHFPMVPMSYALLMTEVLREAATIIMIAGIAVIAGKNFVQRFAYFIFCFAIWDIFYYIFLKLLLDWPESIYTWDILFLIPVPWVGPVISPVIVAITMILLAAIMLHFDSKGIRANLNLLEWCMLCIGSTVLILSWTWDYFNYVLAEYSLSSIWSLSNDAELFQEYVPEKFNWLIFIAGLIILISGIILYIRRLRSIVS